ncbi:MAG TPA: transglutaminase-like domain-containing protein, partial [Phycisphaerales bacterium]|nr:transglutaminase-like domain-containing protein [Phycisphaerales bacterium]
TVIDMGGITIEQLAADKDLALSKLEAPELLNSTMVKTDRPIRGARTLQRGTYRVSVEKETLPDLPTVAGQTFTRESPKAGTVVATADGVEPVAAADLATVKAKHLESSSMLKADDPEIVELVKRAKVQGLPSAEAARKLREFVYGYIRKKDMSVGFATASEVARTKTGDCTEHAALLAAMLRAAGVPSRCASGLLYIDQFDDQRDVFGYHMWTQALVEQKDGTWAWTNLDAVLPGEPYDAAHVLLAVTALGDGEMQNFLVNTAPLIGRLKIGVVETK